jgi:hypothetical protein
VYAAPAPLKLSLSQRAKFRSSPKLTCWWSAAARPERLPQIAAARIGADVLLVERYNHLGGLSTGGLVIWIDRMTDWSGRHIIRGLAGEFMGRLPKDAIQCPPRADWGNRDAATANAERFGPDHTTRAILTIPFHPSEP